jgi:hypothetical protein
LHLPAVCRVKSVQPSELNFSQTGDLVVLDGLVGHATLTIETRAEGR